MGTGILAKGTDGSPQAHRSADRAIEARYTAYLDEAHRLIQAGIEEMTEKSHLDPRVSDIVRRSGLSNKAFYRHFKSKDELLVAVLEENMSTLAQEFEERLTAEMPPVDRVRAWVWGVLEQALDGERSAAHRPLLVYQGRLVESLGPQLWGHVSRIIGLLQEAIAEGREQGALPASVDPLRDGEAIFHLAMGWMQGRVIGRVTPRREEAERVVAFAMRGLGQNGA